jgi:hypothetical protein
VRKERRVYGGEVNNYIENEVVLGHVVKFEVEVQVQREACLDSLASLVGREECLRIMDTHPRK